MLEGEKPGIERDDKEGNGSVDKEARGSNGKGSWAKLRRPSACE